jgi:hypothetical protein
VATERDSTVDAVYTSYTEREESTANAEPEDRVPSIGTLVQYLFTFDAALPALRVDLFEASTKWDRVVAVGGCFAVVPIMWLVAKEMIHWISMD